MNSNSTYLHEFHWNHDNMWLSRYTYTLDQCWKGESMKRITSFFIALLFMFNIAMIPTRAEHATTMHTHDTVQVHENHSKASYFVFQKGTERFLFSFHLQKHIAFFLTRVYLIFRQNNFSFDY